jgi:hypothetical protein
MSKYLSGRSDDKVNRWRMTGWGAAAILLMMPLLAMQFTDEIDWDGFDFAVFGILLALAGGAFELAARITLNRIHMAAFAVALAAAFSMVWINLAVGIVGNEENPANLLYFGVLAIGLIGALAAGGKPQGMARTMALIALAQAMVPAIALVTGMTAANGLPATLAVTAVFCSMWLSSAWLFIKSDPQRAAKA